MERKKRTVISIEDQPTFDFEEAEHSPSYTFPEYQQMLLTERFIAGAIDFGVVALAYLVFAVVTVLQMPPEVSLLDKRVIGIYAFGYLLLVAVYFFLFMVSASQTPGMKWRHLIVVTRDDTTLDLRGSCLRGFGYFISILPLMLGFIWAAIDPEHLTWADKVSSTFVRRV